jgi:hypothetical protein
MKKLLMLLVLLSMCGGMAYSQTYIPKYKKKKEVRDYDLSRSDRNWEIGLGGSCNFAISQIDRIQFAEQGYTIRNRVTPGLMGSNVFVGAQYKWGEHLATGAEGGVLFQDNGLAVPIYGTLNYYYGQERMQQRYRWFNYVHLGPQIYMSTRAKVFGSMAGVGGGLRFLLRREVRFDLYAGYQVNMRRPHINHDGAYDLPEKYSDFKQYMHVLKIGLKMYIF